MSVTGAAISVFAVWAGQRYLLRSNLEVPGGLAFSEFRGYEAWQTVAVSQSGT